MLTSIIAKCFQTNYFRNMFRILSLSFLLLVSLNMGAQNKKTPAKTPVTPVTTNKPTIRKVQFSELINQNDVYYYRDQPYTGISIETFEDKTKMQEIQWKNGLIDGTKTEYFKGGVAVRAKLNFKEGKRNGAFLYYHLNGQLKLCGKYVNDLLDSTVNAFYDNGNPKYTFTYLMGEKTGLSISYYNNGNIEQKVELINEKPNGKMETYYEAGNIRLITTYNQGIREGQFLRYHLNGTIAEESYFKDGIQDSVSYYWDNVFGSIMKIESYNKGKKEGAWVTFNEIGDTLTFYNYLDDILNGPYRIYKTNKITTEIAPDAKGHKRYTSEYEHVLDQYGSYHMGKLDGSFKAGLYERENHVEGHYKDGVMVGEWFYYNAEDKLVLYELYNDQGQLLKQKPKVKPNNEE